MLDACDLSFFFYFILLSFHDFIDVRVPIVEDDGDVVALELLLPLDLHARNLLQLMIFILWDRLLHDFLQDVLQLLLPQKF